MKRVIITATGILFLAGLAAVGQIVPPKKVDQIKKITVVEPESVSLNQTEIWVFLGPEMISPTREGYKLEATVLPAEATTKKVVWESSDPSVATVDAEGRVTPVRRGTAIVRATTVANKLAAECRVTVESMNRPSGNGVSHLNNRGYLARQGSWLYFADPSRGMRLSKMKLDGSSRTPLCDDQAVSINVSGGTVYYINVSDQRRLYSIDIYGQNRKWLNDSNPASSAQVYDGEIMYSSPGAENRLNLYRMNVDGTGRRIVDWPGLGSLSFFHRAGDSAFYSLVRRVEGGGLRPSSIFHRGLDRSAPVTLLTDEEIEGFTVEIVVMSGSYLTGRVFYISQNGELRVIENPLDVKKRKAGLLVSPQQPAKGLSYHDNWLYYYNSVGIHKVRANGRENQRLVQLPAGATALLYPESAGPSPEDTWVFYYVLQTGVAPKLFRIRSNGLENSEMR